MLKLNSISTSIFDAKDISDNKGNQTVKVCSANNKPTEVTYKDIVTTGRMVACEYFGGLVNKRPNLIEKYNSHLIPESQGGVSYATLSQKHKESKLLFCAAAACSAQRRPAPETFDEFKKEAMRYATNSIFLDTLAAIDVDVLSPIYFNIMSDVGMDLMQWEVTGFGQTKEIVIPANDVFLWEDSAYGSERSTSKNYLYAKSITLTPKAYACNGTIKFYQDIVNGEAGSYYGAIVLGMYNKIYAINMSLLKAATVNNRYIPAGLTASTYTTDNYIRITDLVAAANGKTVNDLMAIGTRSALKNILPVDNSGAAITGLQYGLGEKWFTNGFLPKAAGVDLFPVTPAIVPGTQNSDLDTIDTGNNLYILAKGAYKPMVGVYYDGLPLILTATPSGNTVSSYGTADATIDINATAYFDIKPVFASKVGLIKNVF